MKTPVKRILLILFGSGIYWLGYYGFMTQDGGDLFNAGCIILILTGLFMAGWNSFFLSRRK